MPDTRKPDAQPDAERPAGPDAQRPAPATPSADSDGDDDKNRPGDEGPLESLGRAVSAPVRQTADPSEDEKPR